VRPEQQTDPIIFIAVKTDSYRQVEMEKDVKQKATEIPILFIIHQVLDINFKNIYAFK
jgi:hypothetical protein